MPRAPKKCGRRDCEVRVVGATYCTEHSQRPASPSALAARDPRERARRAAVVAAHVAVHGWWCPGWNRPPHESHDLTAKHVRAVAFGGVELDGALCRSCNSRQNTKPG